MTLLFLVEEKLDLSFAFGFFSIHIFQNKQRENEKFGLFRFVFKNDFQKKKKNKTKTNAFYLTKMETIIVVNGEGKKTILILKAKRFAPLIVCTYSIRMCFCFWVVVVFVIRCKFKRSECCRHQHQHQQRQLNKKCIFLFMESVAAVIFMKFSNSNFRKSEPFFSTSFPICFLCHHSTKTSFFFAWMCAAVGRFVFHLKIMKISHMFLCVKMYIMFNTFTWCK